MKKVTRLKPPLRPASLPQASAAPPGAPAPVHSLLCYRLASFILALETGEDWVAADAERVLREAGVVKASFRKSGKLPARGPVYEYRLRLSDGFVITYASSNRKDAWVGAVGLLHSRVVEAFQARVVAS